MVTPVKKNSRRLSASSSLARSEEIDLDLIGALQYWWSKKIQYLLINLGILLALGLCLFLYLQSKNNSELHYSEIVFQTTTTNSPLNLDQIIDPVVIESNIQKEQFQNLDPQRIIQNLSINQSFPQTDRIADQVLAISDTQIKKLALSGDQLEQTILALNALSQRYYALRITHNQTSITPAQADFLLNSLIDSFNQKTSQDVDLQETGLFLLSPIVEEDLQNQNLLFEKLSAIRVNISTIQNQYTELVTATDFSILSTQLNFFDQYLYQSSSIERDETTIRLENRISEIDSKLSSLYEILNLVQNNQSQQSSVTLGNGENSSITQLNNDSIQSLLNLGKELSGVDLITTTAEEIRNLSFQKAELQSQLNLSQELRFSLSEQPSINFEKVNELIAQVNQLTTKVIKDKNPDRYLSVVAPPLYYSDQANLMAQFGRYSMILFVLTFLSTFIFYLLRFQFRQSL